MYTPTLVCVVMVLTRGDWELSWWETNHVSPGERLGEGEKGRGREGGRERERQRERAERETERDRERQRERWGKREMK